MNILILICIVFLWVSFPKLRYTVMHPFEVFKNFIIDNYKFFKYKEYNNFKDFGQMSMYVACDSQPFGSGKTLNLVRYVKRVYKRFNGLPIWSKQNNRFVAQEIRIYSNIKLFGIPFIPLVTEKQIIEASESDSGDNVIHIFIIDEMGSQWNNRSWKTNLNEDLLSAVLQQRKNKLAIIGTVQDFSLFDATLRKVTSRVFECSKSWRFLKLTEYYAKDIERAQSNFDLVKIRGQYIHFADDALYASYDTSEKVSRLCKELSDGERLSNVEVLEASVGAPLDIDSLSNKRKKRFSLKR